MELKSGKSEAAHKLSRQASRSMTKMRTAIMRFSTKATIRRPCGYLSDALLCKRSDRADSSMAQLEKGLALARELAHARRALIHVYRHVRRLYFLRRDP